MFSVDRFLGRCIIPAWHEEKLAFGYTQRTKKTTILESFRFFDLIPFDIPSALENLYGAAQFISAKKDVHCSCS